MRMHRLMLFSVCLTTPTLASVTINTGDGLALSFNDRGQVVSSALDGKSLPAPKEPGGFFLADMIATRTDDLGENLVQNPGFETDAWWTLLGEWSRDNSEAHSAEWSARVHVPGTEDVKTAHLQSPRFAVKPSVLCQLTFWLKIENYQGKSRPTMRIEQWDAEGNKSTDFFQISVPSPYTGTRDWFQLVHLFTTAPKTATISLYANIYGGHGSAWFDDVEVRELAGGLEQPVRGELSGGGREARFVGAAEDVNVTATYEGRDDHMRVRVTLEDLRKQERGVRLFWRLPLDAIGWRWHNDATTAAVIEPDNDYTNNAAIGQGHETARYPLCAVAGDDAGLSLAFPMDVPRVCRMSYDSRLRCLQVYFDLGLSQYTTKFPRQATCEFLLYRHDPGWAFRAALQKYYDIFPQFFTSRIKQHGVWFFSLNTALVPDPETFGLRFDEHGGGHMKYDNDHGIYAFEYTEPWMYKEMLGKIKKEEIPDYEGSMERILKDVDAPAELINKDYYRMPRRDAVRSYLNCAFLDPDGKYIIAGSQYYGYYNRMYVVNPDIEISGKYGNLSRGRISSDIEIQRWFDRAQEQGTRFDGVYLDSIVRHWCSYENFRTDLYQFADLPLCYNAIVHRPCQLKLLCDYELADFYHREMLERGCFVMANIFAPMHTYFGHLLDMLGGGETDGNKPYPQSHFNYLRALCRHKPCSFMDYAYMDSEFTLEQLEEKLQDCLFYAIFPGTAPWKNAGKIERLRPLFAKYIPPMRALSEAGWEPITLATASDPAILVERYGNRDTVLFALKNTSPQRVRVTVSVSQDLFKGGGELVARELMTGKSAPVRRSQAGLRCELTIEGKKTSVLKLRRNQ